jgi:hypothetical protein
MQCALCLQDRTLCNSHIVPQFIFKHVQGDDGEFFVVKTGEEPPSTFYKSFSEKLLCEGCETLFSRWEHYASQFFYGGMPLSGERRGDVIEMQGLDYAMMKLFFMSLLWRFGITSNPWFKGTRLGPHSDRLRSLLLASDPSEPWRYGCLLTAVMHNGTHMSGFITRPDACRFEGHWCQRVVVGGFLLSYFVTSHEPSHPGTKAVLQRNGRFFMHVKDIRQISFLNQAAMDISANLTRHGGLS